MARIEVCDGCGGQGELQAIGYLRPDLEYCPACTPKAQEFVRRVDEAQEEAAALFRERMNAIRAEIDLRETPY